MGVRTNAGGGASVGRLKTALQYADGALGIDVETSSYNEICDALALAYPDQCILFEDGNIHEDITGGWYSYVSGTGTTQIYSMLWAQTGASSGNAILMTQNPIVIPQNALRLNFEIYRNRAQGSYHFTYVGASRSHDLNASIMVVGQTFANTDVFNQTYSFDVSALRGESLYIGIKSYMGGSQSGQFADVYATKIWIELDTPLPSNILYSYGRFGGEWENGVTVFDPDGVPLVGGFTLASDHIQTIIPSSFGQRVLNTANAIDLTNYTKLHIEGSNGSLPAVMDVSGITGSMYITVFTYCNSAQTARVCRVFATPTKVYATVYGVVEICSTAQANNPPSITKIWLE